MKTQKSTYVDGFVIPVKKKNLPAYKKMATMGRNLWMKHGAIDYKECVGDDLQPKGIKFTFPKMAKIKSDETVVFSYITYKSKAHRDAVNKKVMSDPAMNDPKYANMPMPFDMKRFAVAGFKVIVSA